MSELLEILKRVRDGGPYNPQHGICVAVQDEGGSEDEMGELINLYCRWPRYSGDPAFPVPAPDGGCLVGAYADAGPDVVWNPEHPYGAARRELLNWCIEQLEAQQ